MIPEEMEKKFNDMLWKMNNMKTVTDKEQQMLRVAFYEGFLFSQEFVNGMLREVMEKKHICTQK